MSLVPVRLDVSEDQGRVPCVTSVSVGAKPVDIRPSAYVGFPEGINPLSPNRDQHQFSPNNIHTLSREKVMRIAKMITKEEMPWSFIKFSQQFLTGNVWRSVWRIGMWMLGLKGLNLNTDVFMNWAVMAQCKLASHYKGISSWMPLLCKYCIRFKAFVAKRELRELSTL